jgi:hypothetical protein
MLNWKGFGSKLSWPDRGAIPALAWRLLGETAMNPSQDITVADEVEYIP